MGTIFSMVLAGCLHLILPRFRIGTVLLFGFFLNFGHTPNACLSWEQISQNHHIPLFPKFLGADDDPIPIPNILCVFHPKKGWVAAGLGSPDTEADEYEDFEKHTTTGEYLPRQ
jgi:hypothetical protein